MFGIGDPAEAVSSKLSVMGVDKWLAFVLALTQSLICDECTNEVKDPNMTPRAYRLRGSEHFSGPFYVCLADLTHNMVAMALSLIWVFRVHSTPVGLLP